MLKAKKKKHFANYIVVLAVIAVVLYTAAAFILQFFGYPEISATLTTCWFSFWAVELAALASIKYSKVKHEGKKDDTDD